MSRLSRTGAREWTGNALPDLILDKRRGYFGPHARQGIRGGSVPRTVAPARPEEKVEVNGKPVWGSLGPNPVESEPFRELRAGGMGILASYDMKSGLWLFGRRSDFDTHIAMIFPVTGRDETDWVRLVAKRNSNSPGGIEWRTSLEFAGAWKRGFGGMELDEEQAYRNIFKAADSLERMGFSSKTTLLVYHKGQPVGGGTTIGSKSLTGVVALSALLIALVNKFFGGELSEIEMRHRFLGTLREHYRTEFRKGAREHGTEWQTGDAKVIDDLVSRQVPFLRGFLVDLGAGRVSEAQAFNRASMYAKSAKAAYHYGRLLRLEGKNLRWVLSPEAHHCTDCPKLHNQVHPAGWWIEHHLPGDGRTECVTGCACDLRLES